MAPDPSATPSATIDPYLVFNPDEWSRLRADTVQPLTGTELARLRGINERISLEEVERIYLSLSRLLNLHVTAKQRLQQVTSTFLDRPATPSPYIIAIAGSVAVGKSTTARILQALLSRWPDHPHVELITTDGFLFPNRVLEQRNMAHRKGFPESYDVKRLAGFLSAVKAGGRRVPAPVYSHLHYDVMAEPIEIDAPDILIVEGLNVLQPSRPKKDEPARPSVSDFFDFSIYVHAREDDIRHWFLERFRVLRTTAFRDPESYFHRYASLNDDEASAFASEVWTTINALNLRENILPTRERAALILDKSRDHSISRVALRKR